MPGPAPCQAPGQASQDPGSRSIHLTNDAQVWLCVEQMPPCNPSAQVGVCQLGGAGSKALKGLAPRVKLDRDSFVRHSTRPPP